MADEIERALAMATDRTRVAEERFVEEPPGTERSVELAHEVEALARDVEELATDAAGGRADGTA